jgi:cyclophilin family peptidyl-prolyl cis-trans isomerase
MKLSAIILAAPLALVLASGVALADAKDAKKDTPATDVKAVEPAKGEKASGETEAKTEAKTEAPAEEKMAYVLMETSKGNILLELNAEKAPISTKNFLDYVASGHYAGTIFHRVIGNFMIQGGGFAVNMKEKSTSAPIKNEWQNGLKNKRGTIAMARLGGKPDSATAQFFINVVDNDMLDTPRDGAGYAVFGKVVMGMDTVDAIKAVKTSVGDVPTETVEIKSAKKLTADEAKAMIDGAQKPGGDKKPADGASEKTDNSGK